MRARPTTTSGKIAAAMAAVLLLVSAGAFALAARQSGGYGAWCVPGCRLAADALSAPARAPTWCALWTDGRSLCRRLTDGAAACTATAELSEPERNDFAKFARGSGGWRQTWTGSLEPWFDQTGVQQRRAAHDELRRRQGLAPGIEAQIAASPALDCRSVEGAPAEQRCALALHERVIESEAPYCLRILAGAAAECTPGCMIPLDHVTSLGWLVGYLTRSISGSPAAARNQPAIAAPVTAFADLRECAAWRQHCNGCARVEGRWGPAAQCTLLGCAETSSHGLCQRIGHGSRATSPPSKTRSE